MGGGTKISRSTTVVLSRILLHGIIQNFAYNLLTLRDNIERIFDGVALQGLLQSQIFQNFWRSNITASIE